MPSRDYSSHENTWDARNTKAYTAEESYHKYRAEHAGFFPNRHAKYLVGTRVCFVLDKNAEGRSLYLYDLKNRRVGIVVGEAAVRFCDLRLEMHPASLKRGPLPDICLSSILYATGIPPKLTDNMGLPLHSLTSQWPRSKCILPNFHFVVRKSKAGFSHYVFPLRPEIINTILHCYRVAPLNSCLPIPKSITLLS
jgi:hypothetical protein